MRKHETSFTYTGSGTPAITVASPTTEYQENITYDANGNILTYLRNGSSSQLAMDNLVYRYTTTHNRLRYVDDGVNAANYAEDIDDQASGNYNYDRIGNLTLDVKEKISNIEWTVYGKIRKITKNDVAGTVIEYEYDASGNRIYKKVSANNITSYTFYVRDAQGNTLAVYIKEDQDPIKWSEQHLYGSSRVGMVNLNITVPSNISWPAPVNTMQDGFDYGKTVYELSNHLGNVLATITDQKDAVQNGSTGVVGYYKAVSMTQTDYYPFGMQMVGRAYRLLGGYRYGFNGKENDIEVKGVEGSQQDYGMRIYDPRIGKFLSVDPISIQYPELTPYQFASNRPIDGIDLDGLEYIVFHVKVTKDASGKLVFTKTIAADYRDRTALEMAFIHNRADYAINFYNKYSESFGPEGRGFKWIYYDENGEKLGEAWQMKQDPKIINFKNSGYYSGAGSITKFGPGLAKNNTLYLDNDYDFSYEPMSTSDGISKEHDLTQETTISQPQGWLEDTRTLASDIVLLYKVGQALKHKHWNSNEDKARLNNMKTFFTHVVNYKMWKIRTLRENNWDENKAENQLKIIFSDWSPSFGSKEYKSKWFFKLLGSPGAAAESERNTVKPIAKKNP